MALVLVMECSPVVLHLVRDEDLPHSSETTLGSNSLIDRRIHPGLS